MSEFVNTIDVIGDDALTDSILNRTITEYKSDAVRKIGTYAFVYCKSLTNVEVPNATEIGAAALRGCSKLMSIYAPKVQTIGSSALQESSIIEANFPELTTISGSYAFSNCKGLRTVNMPKLRSANTQTFSSCAFESVVFPSLGVLYSQSLWACNSLRLVDLPVGRYLSNNAFSQCKAFNVLILRKSDGVCTLEHVGAFAQTPFASGGTGGTVYVPQALITEYQNATNWSTLYAAGTCNFVALEGSEYE